MRAMLFPLSLDLGVIQQGNASEAFALASSRCWRSSGRLTFGRLDAGLRRGWRNRSCRRSRSSSWDRRGRVIRVLELNPAVEIVIGIRWEQWLGLAIPLRDQSVRLN